jgi:hypothetical protein
MSRLNPKEALANNNFCEIPRCPSVPHPGQKIARRIKPGSQQQGQYSNPSIHPGSADDFSCQALGREAEEEEEPDYELDLPDSALGPWR